MSLARLAFVAKKWDDAEERSDGIIRQYPDSGVAASTRSTGGGSAVTRKRMIPKTSQR